MAKIIVPAITVFDDHEKPDYKANEKVIDFLIANGIDGILTLGSAGEFPGLTFEEKEDFLKFYTDYVKGRTELYAGTGSANFNDTVKLTKSANRMGYKAPLVIGPYYYALSQEKIFLFYDTLAKSVEGDLYIYNFPARSGHSVAPETVRKLVEANSNITGLKDSVPECNHTNLICLATEGKEFHTYSGFDDQFLYNLSSGGDGCIGGLANVVPEIWSDLVRSANQNDFKRSIKLSYLIHKLMPLYDLDDNCSLLFKKLLVHRGVDIATTAVFPYNQMNDDIYQKAVKLLDDVLAEYRALAV